MKYILWAEGNIWYEGIGLGLAKEWRDQLINDGYEDVVIEKEKER
tara:strand:- start:591 stop:725 length:135 start_codon:yes stop_codon:yes gene_type:complete